MSYDLFFTAPKISEKEFEAYFSQNPHYKLNNGQAFYSNEITGVYFSFDYEENGDYPENNVEASFNLNYFRPHFFGLEAAVEVEKFVSHFNCEIEDPQTHGMGNDVFTKAGFLKGWNNGNKFGVGAILSRSENPTPPDVMPTAALEQMWEWNFSINEKEMRLLEDIFIPRIMFFRVDGVVGTGAVWPDAIPTLIPDVDFLVVPRRESAPKKLFKKKVEDRCVILKSDFPDFFSNYVLEDGGIRAFKLPTPETPIFIKKYISRLDAFDGEIERIANESVLNKEIVDSI